jgi:hypothetical protein
MAGKISRMLALQVDSPAIVVAALEFALELLLLGYPKQFVRGVLHACRKSQPAIGAQQIFRKWLIVASS